jgi:hypothetical protein
LDIQTKMRRLEQQLSAFEQLHKNELVEFERKLAIYKQLHKNEVNLLLEEVAKIKEIIENQAIASSQNIVITS